MEIIVLGLPQEGVEPTAKRKGDCCGKEGAIEKQVKHCVVVSPIGWVAS